MTRLGTNLARRLGTTLGVNLAGGAVTEAPQQIPGLMAWFDSRTAAQMNPSPETGISSWTSRAGSLGTSLAWTQANPGNRPVLVNSEPLLGGRPAVRFDGIASFLDTNTPSAWTFMHNGTGQSCFRVLRIDGSLAANQTMFSTAGNVGNHGVLDTYTTSSCTLQVFNSSGTAVNAGAFTTAAQWARNVSRWQLTGYVAGTRNSSVSGSSQTVADTAGVPSANSPTRIARLGAVAAAASGFFRGWLGQDIYYDHVLTAGETSQLAAWAAAEYGVAA